MSQRESFHFEGFAGPHYTQIPDVVFDRVMAHLSGAEFKVLLYICRRTFGWKKTYDDISLAQICEGIVRQNGEHVDEGTGLATSTAVMAVKGLEEKGLISRRRNSSERRGFEATTYALRFRQTPSPEIEEGTSDIRRTPSSISGEALHRKSKRQQTRQQTDQQTTRQQQQHQPASGSGVPPPVEAIVVVAVENDPLVARGVTAAIAGRLQRTVPAEVIARQVEIFDYLRDEAPGDTKLTPGRLRRQIEEDWATPAAFVPTAERAALAEVSLRQARDRELAAAASARRAATDGERRQARLDTIGLAGADQAFWARIVQAAPPLPPPFRDALFHAPRSDEAAAVIFRDPTALARATGPAHAGTRAQVVARVADLCGRHGVPVHYLVYDDVLRLVRGENAAAEVAAYPAQASP